MFADLRSDLRRYPFFLGMHRPNRLQQLLPQQTFQNVAHADLRRPCHLNIACVGRQHDDPDLRESRVDGGYRIDAAHGTICRSWGMASSAPLKGEERTIGAPPPIELRLFIAHVGRGAPPSKSISISLRELANAGNVIAVLRSVVSMTSPESPTNTYLPSRLWC